MWKEWQEANSASAAECCCAKRERGGGSGVREHSRGSAATAVGEADRRMFEAFLSKGEVSLPKGGEEATMAVLRDMALGQSFLVAGVIDLPESAAVGRSCLVKGFG